MPDGTALPRFKRAFIQTLQGNGVSNIAYQSPMQPDDMMGDDGSGLCGWFADTATGNLDITLLGSTLLYIDETWNVPFRIQALGSDTGDDQETVDQAACELLGDVITAFADPSFGIPDDEIQTFAALPVGANPWGGGVLASNLRAARFEVSIELTARIQITRSTQ